MLDKISTWLAELGKQESIRDRWSLNPKYPTPSDAEENAFESINNFLAKNPTVTTSGITVQLGDHIDAYLAYLICCDAYEHGDLELIEKHVSPASQAVVLGGGIGIVASALAKHSGAKTTVYEANPLMLPHIIKTAALNKISFDVKQGLIARTGNTLVPFHISSEFWASSTREETYKKHGTLELKTISFITALSIAELAFIDIEGGEVDLFFDDTPTTLREIFIEIHTPGIGAIEASKVMNRIWRQGFQLIDQEGLTSFWRR